MVLLFIFSFYHFIGQLFLVVIVYTWVYLVISGIALVYFPFSLFPCYLESLSISASLQIIYLANCTLLSASTGYFILVIALFSLKIVRCFFAMVSANIFYLMSLLFSLLILKHWFLLVFEQSNFGCYKVFILAIFHLRHLKPVIFYCDYFSVCRSHYAFLCLTCSFWEE